MKIFGFEITRTKAAVPAPISSSYGPWYPVVREPYPGAWQRGVAVNQQSVLAFHAVFSCITLIASDIAKLRVKLVELGDNGVWSETASPAYSPVLRKPNDLQNRIQFWESYVLSKLLRGNTYVLKGRDARGVVTRLWVLSPDRVKPLVADDGSVFYDINADNMVGLANAITVPAREIIHDRWNCLFHPLCGISPIFACGLSSMQGLNIQEHATKFFANAANPGGMLVAPGKISQQTADELRDKFTANFGGSNAGRLAVVGDGLKFEQLSMTAVDAQMIEQLKWTAEVVCSTFHVPPYKVGIGQMPTYNNIQALNVEYYTQCLQTLIEAAELCLDEGLGTGERLGTEFDLDGLLRMDSVTQAEVTDKKIKSGVLSPNEARAKDGLQPVKGGESPYLQEQNYSLAALAKRDALDNPFGAKTPEKPAPATPPAADTPALPEKGLEHVGDSVRLDVLDDLVLRDLAA